MSMRMNITCKLVPREQPLRGRFYGIIKPVSDVLNTEGEVERRERLL